MDERARVKSPLGVDDLRVVLEELYVARTHWYTLGLGLGLKPDVLDAIGDRCSKDPNECFCDTLKDYLKTVTPSWRALGEALRSPIVNQPQLAEKVEQKYCPALRPNTQDSPPLLDESLPNSQGSSLPVSPPVLPGPGVMSETENELHTFAMQISALSTDEQHLPEDYGCGCGECSVNSLFEKGCPKPIHSMSAFTRLNTVGLDDSQKDLLKGRLYHEYVVIRMDFGRLIYKTCRSMIEQHITVQELVRLLRGLDAFQPTLRKTPLLCIEELQAADSIDKVFAIIQRYMSFFSYYIIEYIIDEFGTQQDKENLHSYTTKLNEYSRRSIFECPAYSQTRKNQANLVVKLEGIDLERYNLIHLAVFKSRISNIIKVTKYTLRLCTVEEGCLQLTFQIPHFVKEVIFPLADSQKAALKVEGVAHLTCEYHQCLLEETALPEELLLPLENVADMASEDIFPPEEYVQPDMVQQQSRLLEGSEESGTQYMVTEETDSLFSEVPPTETDSLFSGVDSLFSEVPPTETDSLLSRGHIKLADAQLIPHKHIGRMEAERLLMECHEDGAFLIRESDMVKGAYVLSTIYHNRIHHYLIIPDEEGQLSIKAQQGVQKKHFSSLEDLVQFYSEPKRGLVCGLTTPISQKENEEESAEADDESDPDDEPDEVSRQHNIIPKFLLASLSTVDTTKVDKAFLELLKTYLNTEVLTDVESMVTPIPQLTCLKELFAKKCKKLHQQLDVFMLQVELVQSLFERAGGTKEAGQSKAQSLRHRRSKFGDSDFDSLGHKLTECSGALQNMETTAFQMFRELSVSISDRPAHSSSLSQVASGSAPEVNRKPESDQKVSFDVKVDVGLAGKKNYIITVSLKEGTLTFCKAGESYGSIVGHQQLLQLVKSRSREQRLGILIDGQSRKDYNFNSMQAREHFCQLIQLIRNNFRAEEDQDSISVFVGTWNMDDASPPNNIDSWLRSLGLGKTLPPSLAHPHDIYAIGTQECSISEKEWTNKIKCTLKNLFDIEYKKLATQTLWGIQLMLFVKPEHTTKITHVQYSHVRTGFGNAIGNKGAVGISFSFGSMSLCFINAHLTSGVERYHRRNQNYHDILRGMGALKQKRLSQFDLTNQFHHLFFFGDLNYRVVLGATEIVEIAKRQDHFALYQEDQLRKDKDRKKIFVGFEEAPILFPPTCRFIKNQRTLDSYVWHKQKRGYICINVPSFCDRVLWKSFPAMNLLNTSYGCTKDIMTSDHSPVFATFQIRGVKQYVPEAARPLPSSNQNSFIILDSCKAKIQTSSRTYFYIELYSTCFEGVVRSSPNNDCIEDLDENYMRPVWCGREHTAKVRPILPEQDYLEQQHVLLMLKSQESDEPYAECCISLRDIISPTPVCVRNELIHQGMSVGDLEAYIHVTLDRYKTEEEQEANIYSDVNFITAETEEVTSLDFRGRTSQSTRTRLNLIENQPRMPILRTRHSALDQSRVARRNIGSFAPPIPKRRLTAIVPTALPARTPYRSAKILPLYSQGTMPPTVPTQRPDCAGAHHGHDRPEKLLTVDGLSSSQIRAQLGSPPQGGPPVPMKRKLPPRPGGSANSSPPPLPVNSSGTPLDAHFIPHRHLGSSAPGTVPLSPLPPKSSDPHPLPAARHGQTQVRSRPLSTVENLLETHGLQQFSQKLVQNGYDDIHFIHEISDQELKEIGVTNPTDRKKLLKVFASYHSQ